MMGPGADAAADLSRTTALAGACAAVAFAGALTTAALTADAFDAGFAAAALAGALTTAALTADALDAGFAGAAFALLASFAAGLAVVLAETVFLGLVGLADGFFAGIYGLRGKVEGRGIIQTGRGRSTHSAAGPEARRERPAGPCRCCENGRFLLHLRTFLEPPPAAGERCA